MVVHECEWEYITIEGVSHRRCSSCLVSETWWENTRTRITTSLQAITQVFQLPQWAVTEGDSNVVAIVTDLHYGSVFALRRSSIGMWSAVTSSVVGRHFEAGAARIESPSLPILERLLETVGVEQTRYSKDTPRSFCPGCGGLILHPEAGIGECASCQAKAVIVYTIRG